MGVKKIYYIIIVLLLVSCEKYSSRQSTLNLDGPYTGTTSGSSVQPTLLAKTQEYQKIWENRAVSRYRIKIKTGLGFAHEGLQESLESYTISNGKIAQFSCENLTDADPCESIDTSRSGVSGIFSTIYLHINELDYENLEVYFDKEFGFPAKMLRYNANNVLSLSIEVVEFEPL